MMGILGALGPVLGIGKQPRTSQLVAAGGSWWQLVNVYSDSLRLVRQLFM